MTRIAAIAIALALAGCAATGTPSTTMVSQGATSLCNFAASSLKLLTPMKLTPAQVQSVHDAEMLTDPVCLSPTPPTDAVQAAADLAAGLAMLAAIKSQTGATP